ncbi:MAG: pyrroloquinoline quinone precursor peptide PqqA [Burkholderiales bacterium]|nr:pyrroloquinoline quinone precursor peptide PqqA [Burkholderiales bacterium]
MCERSPVPLPSDTGGNVMQWIDPAFCDIRLGFEVTAYVYVR